MSLTDRLRTRWARHRVARELGKRTVDSESESSRHHDYERNKQFWDNWDWSSGGEEWTEDVHNYRGLDPDRWKSSLIERFIDPYVGASDVVVEIGPGAGRWTAVLSERAEHVVAADISEVCLDRCRGRFADREGITYLLIGPDHVLDVETASIDTVWSYDVFVHINPVDIDGYLPEIFRALKPGGRAVIHHAGGNYPFHPHDLMRAHMTAEFFASLALSHGFEVLVQDADSAHLPGDVITVLRRPTG